jgi:hypothetical protein
MAKLSEHAVMAGFFWGILGGALIALFRAPRIKPMQQLQEVRQEVREKLEAVIPGDAITDGIVEGKAAARRRLAELGLLQEITPVQ